MSELTPSNSSPTSHPPAPSVTYANGNIVIDGLPTTTSSKSYSELADCKLMSIVHSYKHLLTHGTRAGKRASEKMKRQGMPLDNDIFQVPVAYTFITIPRPLTPTETNPQDIPYGSIDDEAVILYTPTEVNPEGTSHDLADEAAASYSIVITIVINSAYKPIIRAQEADSCSIEVNNCAASGDPTLQPANPLLHLLVPHTKIKPPQPTNKSWCRFLDKRRNEHTDVKAEQEIPEGFREMTAQEVRAHIDYYGKLCAQEIQEYLLDVHSAAVHDGTIPDYFR